jgi:NAD(P)-dependent dehydrogenase (short-subunit alcohol dehydrogenase family)
MAFSESFVVHTAQRAFPYTKHGGKFDAVIWAQGWNLTEILLETNNKDWEEIFHGNLNIVRESLIELLNSNKLQPTCALVVVSSIWGQIAKENKSAYISSKSALNGLVRALAVELGSNGMRINAVSPGIVDNVMSRKNLSSHQIEEVARNTPSGKLVTAENVANLIYFLASSKSEGINGQILTIDNGWTISRYV